MDFTVNLLVRSVIRTTHPLAMCPPNPFTEVLLVNPGYWGAYPRVLRVLTVHQKLEPNRGMNFLRTRETFCLSNLKKKLFKDGFFLSLPEEFCHQNLLFSVGWVRLSIALISRIWKKSGARSSATPVRWGMWPHGLRPASAMPLKHADDSSWLVMRRITSFKLHKFWRITCVMLWCSPASEALQLHSTSTISARRELLWKTSTEGLDTSLGPQWRKHFLAEETIKQNKAVGKVRWHLILHGTFTYVFFTGEGGFGSKMKNVGYQNKLHSWSYSALVASFWAPILSLTTIYDIFATSTFTTASIPTKPRLEGCLRAWFFVGKKQLIFRVSFNISLGPFKHVLLFQSSKFHHSTG